MVTEPLLLLVVTILLLVVVVVVHGGVLLAVVVVVVVPELVGCSFRRSRHASTRRHDAATAAAQVLQPLTQCGLCFRGARWWRA
jgi:hypothetical protein